MSISIGTRFMYILDIVLRVPPLFVMDAILNRGYPYEYTYRLKPFPNDIFKEIPPLPHQSEPKDIPDSNHNNNVDFVFISSISFDLQTVVLFFINLTGFFLAFIVFLLSRDHLIATNKWFVAILAVFISYWGNSTYIKGEVLTPEALQLQHYKDSISNFWLHLMLQTVVTVIFSFTHYLKGTLGILILLSFIVPTLFSAIPYFPHSFLHMLPVGSLLVILIYMKICLLMNINNIYTILKNAFRRCRMIIRYYGLHTLLENEWLRLNVPHVLRVFWLTRITEHIVFLLADKMNAQLELHNVINLSINNASAIVKDVLVRGCDTMVAVLGMTSVVASLSHYLGYIMQQFLMTEDEEEKSIGTVSAVLFFILALQTGLTGLEPEKRFVRLYRNFCLLFTAILHFIHNMVNPLLMSLSASRNRSMQRHGRALAICAFLIAFPCWFLAYLWTRHTISTWLLAVSAFSIEVVIKVIISLLIYLLFMIDAYRNTFWEQLDDYVYYIRATGNTIEFIFGIFLFFNGAWILLFESGGAIRACMMCIHAYFNIWLQAKAGWKTFMKRRTAVNKINALPEATEEQLRRFDDVCAICYQELTNARITKCNHYFHGVCLRKWLYVQDRCPLCHDTLYKIDSENEDYQADIPPNGEANNEQQVRIINPQPNNNAVNNINFEIAGPSAASAEGSERENHNPDTENSSTSWNTLETQNDSSNGSVNNSESQQNDPLPRMRDPRIYHEHQD